VVTERRDIVERLRAWVTDWDGSQMVDGEPPRDGLHCNELREAAAEILRFRAALASARNDALEEAASVLDIWAMNDFSDEVRATGLIVAIKGHAARIRALKTPPATEGEPAAPQRT